MQVWLVFYKTLVLLIRLVEGGDELVPVDGKDEIYDNIMTKIDELERELAQRLKKFEKSLG